MELVVFVGLQGSGKSTFYMAQFADTHLRINLDMLRTRRRETAILEASFRVGQRVVIDNTNPAVEERAAYLAMAKVYHFEAVAYFFDAAYEVCKERNSKRVGKKRIPEAGLKATAKKLVAPTRAEGFGAIYRVGVEGGAVLVRGKDEV